MSVPPRYTLKSLTVVEGFFHVSATRSSKLASVATTSVGASTMARRPGPGAHAFAE